MQAKEGVVEKLNAILTIDLTAINQYFIHSEMARNWGFQRVADHLRELSMGEMQDAQNVVRHILFLGGLPNLQRLGQVKVGESIVEDLELDLTMELETVDALREAIAHCESVGDYGTREMLDDMLSDEETHVDWLETQHELIRQVGVEHYLAQNIRE